MAPKSEGSPECTRATSLPAAWAASISATISSSVSDAVSSTLASAGAPATTSLGTREPA
jgi:hypothetical protein